ncbi:Hypothetical protein POVN_LOCUS470 [uncultured virus]|nr:Hypothetical protein POVN_LOCUS470 [uncultured virus]
MSIALLIDLGERLKMITMKGEPEDAAALMNWALKGGLATLDKALVRELKVYTEVLPAAKPEPVIVKDPLAPPAAFGSILPPPVGVKPVEHFEAEPLDENLFVYKLPTYKEGQPGSHLVTVRNNDKPIVYIYYGKGTTYGDIHSAITRNMYVKTETVYGKYSRYKASDPFEEVPTYDVIFHAVYTFNVKCVDADGTTRSFPVKLAVDNTDTLYGAAYRIKQMYPACKDLKNVMVNGKAPPFDMGMLYYLNDMYNPTLEVS